jgi:transposase-like protein
VLVALGLRPDGTKEIIDFRLATAESGAQWEQFLGDRSSATSRPA